MGDLILIGTHHGDLRGEERLEHLLKIIQPDILSIEVSKESLNLSQKRLQDVEQLLSEMEARGVSKPYIQFLRDLGHDVVIEGFEYDSPRSYADTHRIPLHLSDDPATAEEAWQVLLKELRANLNRIPANMTLIIPSERDLMENIDASYEYAHSVLQGNIPQHEIDTELDTYRGVVIGQRDAYIELQIRKILSEHPSAKLVQVIGCSHLFPDSKGETLYSRLQDLHPQRQLLYTPPIMQKNVSENIKR